MTTGLTIAIINKKDYGTNKTNANYKKFGKKYWDDAKGNKSKLGYYFVYYYKKEYVNVHKIINISPPNERPPEMEDWSSNENTIHLSEQLKQFTWDEWITSIGKGAPYACDYRQTHTISKTKTELKQTHPTFNFANFVKNVEETNDIDNIVESKIITEIDTKDTKKIDTKEDRPNLVIKENDEEEIYDEESMKKEDAEIEEAQRKLDERKAENMRKRIIKLREERNAKLDKDIKSSNEIIKTHQLEIDNLYKEIATRNESIKSEQLKIHAINCEKLSNTNGENDKFLIKLLK
jgi:hypothetical protein